MFHVYYIDDHGNLSLRVTGSSVDFPGDERKGRQPVTFSEIRRDVPIFINTDDYSRLSSLPYDFSSFSNIVKILIFVDHDVHFLIDERFPQVMDELYIVTGKITFAPTMISYFTINDTFIIENPEFTNPEIMVDSFRYCKVFNTSDRTLNVHLPKFCMPYTTRYGQTGGINRVHIDEFEFVLQRYPYLVALLVELETEADVDKLVDIYRRYPRLCPIQGNQYMIYVADRDRDKIKHLVCARITEFGDRHMVVNTPWIKPPKLDPSVVYTAHDSSWLDYKNADYNLVPDPPNEDETMGFSRLRV